MANKGAAAITVGSALRGTINPKSRHFYWSLSRSADSTANENDVIRIDPRVTDPTVSTTAPTGRTWTARGYSSHAID